jgi:hypothetical protein
LGVGVVWWGLGDVVWWEMGVFCVEVSWLLS